MGLFLYIAGFGQLFAAITAWGLGISAMHEMIAATLSGFGFVTIALAAIHDLIRYRQP